MVNASPSSVLTKGFGSWGSANLIITIGYGQAGQGPILGPGVFRRKMGQAGQVRRGSPGLGGQVIDDGGN